MSNDVLVLNASYEPLTRVSWQRAAKLVFSGKTVVTEAHDDKFIRHKGEEVMEWPKTILLTRYIRVPYIYKELPYTKAGVLKRDNYLCVYCLGKADTVEHILPQSTHPELARDWMNTVAACFDCNNKRGDRPLSETSLVMQFEPHIPFGVRRK